MKLDSESVFIHPTDTVWGIGGSIYSQSAREKISEIKGAPLDKPLSIMFTDIKTLHSSFNFPEDMGISWLRTYFKLESTLGIPLKISKIPIPSWVNAKSDIVSVRCLDIPVLRAINESLKTPFFTTSLNITGLEPIVNFNDAQAFQKEHAPNTTLFGDSTHNLSGHSSSIVFFRGSSFEIIRSGRKIEELKKHLKLAGFPLKN